MTRKQKRIEQIKEKDPGLWAMMQLEAKRQQEMSKKLREAHNVPSH